MYAVAVGTGVSQTENISKSAQIGKLSNCAREFLSESNCSFLVYQYCRELNADLNLQPGRWIVMCSPRLARTPVTGRIQSPPDGVVRLRAPNYREHQCWHQCSCQPWYSPCLRCETYIKFSRANFSMARNAVDSGKLTLISVSMTNMFAFNWHVYLAFH